MKDDLLRRFEVYASTMEKHGIITNKEYVRIMRRIYTTMVREAKKAKGGK